MKKTFVSWEQSQSLTLEILRQMQKDCWIPDLVVGIVRGGVVPANLISQYLDVPMWALKVSLRNHEETETNAWMPEEAAMGRKILLVDDINDSGATLNWIEKDWGSDIAWAENVRVAVLYDNESSDCRIPISYSAVDINKATDPQWIVFPWEQWWQK